jgi:hypothetical protein
VERTFDALADANADARELDEAVRSGMDMALDVAGSVDDEDEIKAELAALEAEAIAEAQIVEKAQQPVALGTERRDDVVDSIQQGRERASTRDANGSDRRPEQVLAG